MKLTYIFRCPVCSKLFKMDEPGEPVCTGPSEMRDDHPHTVMRTSARRGKPAGGEARGGAAADLGNELFDDKVVRNEARIILAR
jgi:hypothetical protein